MTGPYPDPQQVNLDGAAGRINRENRERYLDLWDAGDAEDERRAQEEIDAMEWHPDNNPSRPRDSELLPK